MKRFLLSAFLSILLFDKMIIIETSTVSQKGVAELEPTKQFRNRESVRDYLETATNKIDQTCESVVKLFCYKVGVVDGSPEYSADLKFPDCEKKLKHLFLIEIPRMDAKNFIPISMALDSTNVCDDDLISSLNVAFDKLSYATRWPHKTSIENNQMQILSLRHSLKSVIFGDDRTKFYTTHISLTPIAKEYTNRASVSFIVNHINEVEQCLSYMEEDRVAYREEIIDKLHAALLAKEKFQECCEHICNVIKPILEKNGPIRKADKIQKDLIKLLEKFVPLQAHYLMTLNAVNDKLMKYYEKWAQFLLGYGLSTCAGLIELDKKEKAQAQAFKKAQKTTRRNGEKPDRFKPIEKPKKWNFNLISFFKKFF